MTIGDRQFLEGWEYAAQVLIANPNCPNITGKLLGNVLDRWLHDGRMWDAGQVAAYNSAWGR